mgnify:CR=1 FL=1
MNELYLMFTIVDRNKTKRFLSLYESCGVNVTFGMVGEGTANSELLDAFGLERTEKAVLTAAVTDVTWKEIRRGLERRLQIDVPGTGIAFTVPMSSIGGKPVLNYLTESQNYEKGEPIFLSELPGGSRDYLRQEMRQLVKNGKLERLYNGVYYLPYVTILGTKGKVSIDRYIEKKYLNARGMTSGYVTGIQLANQYGFTTQNPSCYEVCSNEATTKQRKQTIDGSTIIIYQPVTAVDEQNKYALQFLDLMTVIHKYSEVTGDEMKSKLKKYTDSVQLDFSTVKKYLPLYPDRVYRNLYEGGMMNELV